MSEHPKTQWDIQTIHRQTEIDGVGDGEEGEEEELFFSFDKRDSIHWIWRRK